MTEEWKWWVGSDDERFTTECNTREEAVQIARDEYEGAYIIEATRPSNIKLSSYFSVVRFIEDAEDRAYDDHADEDGNDYVFNFPPGKSVEIINDLESVVQAAIDDWQERNGLTFTGFKFTQVRNQEYIPPVEESEDDR